MVRLVVGLGNPGKQYEKTRHNAGFWFIDQLAGELNAKLEFDKKFNGHKALIESNFGKFWLLKPETYMNLSGQSVQAMLKYYDFDVDECLIVHDELDFDSGIVRLKQGGGAAGHNGLKSIMGSIGSPDFLRLRLGIGRSKNRQTVADYVLSVPSISEIERINLAISKGISGMPLILKGEFEAAMRELHE